MTILLQDGIHENDIIRTLDGIVYTLDPVTTLATTASVTSLSQTPTAQTSSTFVTSYITMVSATNSIVEQSTRKLSNKKTSLIIGLTIGCSVTLVLLVLVLLFLLNKHKKLDWFHLKKTRQTRAWEPGYFENEKTDIWDDSFDVDENSVTMHYKVLKNSSNYGHIKTPQQAYSRNNISQSDYSNEKHSPQNTLEQHYESSLYTKNIDRYLYERPPQIQQISSEIPSNNSSQENVSSGKFKPTWKYGSPLSKWFLGSSTYLAQGVQNSPQINLKDFKLQRSFDERSPILASSRSNPLYGVIQKQSTSTNEYETFPTGKLQLQAISPEKIKIKRNKSKLSRKNTLLKKKLKDITKHLIEIHDQKPLPQAPLERKTVDIKEYRKSTYLETMTLYEVICEYTPQLLDELHITPGEYVKVLATHTDGWCLVERSNYFVKMNANIDGEDYLNENRGIVPLSHLKKL